MANSIFAHRYTSRLFYIAGISNTIHTCALLDYRHQMQEAESDANILPFKEALSMPKVMVLADHIASQIAAGEVVERPSSVVKELVENAVDSGAAQIEISIGNDCRSIRVADDGCGMDGDDAVLAFHRHATSKLRNVEDLWNLHSLGFRGEALPSIASVSRVTCYTRTRSSSEGSKIDCADGKVTTTVTGCAPGTAMEIHDLFYNVPARLSFLKRASTEFGHIQETVQYLAISYPHVAFNLLNNGVSMLSTTGSGNLRDAIKESGLFTGREALVEVSARDERLGMSIDGWLARPMHFRGDRKGILSIVNNRPVRCPLTYKALDYAYSDLIPRGRHPLAVVSVKVEPQYLDVNIHPTKKEIKYSNGNEVYIAIQRALMASLRAVKMEMRAQEAERSSGAYGSNFGSDGSVGRSTDAVLGEEGNATSSGADRAEAIFVIGVDANANANANASANASASASASAPGRQLGFRDDLSYHKSTHSFAPDTPPSWRASGVEQFSLGEGTGSYDATSSDLYNATSSDSYNATSSDSYNATSSDSYNATSSSSGSGSYASASSAAHITRLPLGWRIAGYIHNTYVVVETPEGMEILEQHILHERTLYERLIAKQTISGRTTEYGQRLLICAPLDLTTDQQSILVDHCVLLERLGFEFDIQEGSVTCVQVPLELAHRDYASAIQSMIEQLAIADSAELELEATKSIACQSAIKNGMPLGESDLIKLISEWYVTPRNDTCPHGRPVRLQLSMAKLFEMFHPA